jgi:hypothetical protein
MKKLLKKHISDVVLDVLEGGGCFFKG